MILDKLAARVARPAARDAVTLESVGLAGLNLQTGETAALKLAVVNRCLDVISDSMGKMPSYCTETVSRERRYPQVLELLAKK